MASGAIIGFAILTFVLAYLALNTPEEHGALQIGNYILVYLMMFFTGYLSYATVEADENAAGLLLEWNNAFAWVLYIVVAYFMIYMLYKAFKLSSGNAEEG